MPDQREDVVNAMQASAINYNTCFQSVLPRLQKQAVPPYGDKKPLGPDSYDKVIGLEHHRSITAEITKDTHELSKFKSTSPRFQGSQEHSERGILLVPGPGSYELDQLLPSAADIHDPARRSMVFNSKVNRFPNARNGGTAETLDSRDSTWKVERDQENYWRPPIWAKFTGTPRFSQGAQMPDGIHESAWNRPSQFNSAAAKENSYADLCAYDVDNTSLVNKYKPIAMTAGAIPMPPRPKKTTPSPRSKFLDDLRVCNAPPLDFSFLQLKTLADLHMAMEENLERQMHAGSSSNSQSQSARAASPRASINATSGMQGTGAGTGGSGGDGAMEGDEVVAPAVVRVRKRVTAIKLNNNQFTSINGVGACLAAGVDWKPPADKKPSSDSSNSSKPGSQNSAEVEPTESEIVRGKGGAHPTDVRWLDVSHNRLDFIDEKELCAFTEMRVLNLQANNIARLKEVQKLKPMRNLRTLTLFANPVAQKKNYRWYIIAVLPQLTKLDSTVITEKERRRANHWWSCREAAKKRAQDAA